MRQLKKRGDVSAYLNKFINRNSVLDHIFKMAIYLQSGNQGAAVGEIDNFYKYPVNYWLAKRIYISNQDVTTIKDYSNYIILYVLGQLEPDVWREALWAFLKHFSLPDIKLNEVRDFEILSKRHLLKRANHLIWGERFLVGWSQVFEELKLDNELQEWLRTFSVDKIKVENLSVFVNYYTFLNRDQQQEVVKLCLKNKDVINKCRTIIGQQSAGKRE